MTRRKGEWGIKDCNVKMSLLYEVLLTYINFHRKDHLFSPERVKLLHELSKMEDIYERLARAIAPSIYENEDIKKGILLQLFGGTKKSFTTSGRGNFRYLFLYIICVALQCSIPPTLLISCFEFFFNISFI
jgi:DNA replicative helicase MCM subunit Mcm2 (Cdc46/Mcm family)